MAGGPARAYCRIATILDRGSHRQREVLCYSPRSHPDHPTCASRPLLRNRARRRLASTAWPRTRLPVSQGARAREPAESLCLLCGRESVGELGQCWRCGSRRCHAAARYNARGLVTRATARQFITGTSDGRGDYRTVFCQHEIQSETSAGTTALDRGVPALPGVMVYNGYPGTKLRHQLAPK
jgi:hypothetical protein